MQDRQEKRKPSEAVLAPFRFDWSKQWTIPNFLTLIRLIAIPFMAYYLYTIDRHLYLGVGLFATIWATDVLDGFIARHFNQVSDLGKLFDPAVDKLFQFATAIALCLNGRVPLWVPIFIAFKELAMSIGSMILLSQNIVVYAHWVGKIATILFTVAFTTCLFLPEEALVYRHLIFALPTLCAILAFTHYGKQYFSYRKTRRA